MKYTTRMIVWALLTFVFGMFIGHTTKNVYVLLIQPVFFMIGTIIGQIFLYLKNRK
jgi:hypothetical protein